MNQTPQDTQERGNEKGDPVVVIAFVNSSSESFSGKPQKRVPDELSMFSTAR
jgi:hypothetical protein